VKSAGEFGSISEMGRYATKSVPHTRRWRQYGAINLCLFVISKLSLLIVVRVGIGLSHEE
jgi:hypothetical protein